MNGRIVLASQEEGVARISAPDEFLTRLTPMERRLRMRAGGAGGDDFDSFLCGSVLPWSAEEAARMEHICAELESLLCLRGIAPLRSAVRLIKTSGREEWNSAYTRSDAIFLPAGRLARTDAELLALIAHEYCHAYLRMRSILRAPLYYAAGFELIDEVKLPASLEARKLTNPDAPVVNCLIETSDRGEAVSATPVAMLREGGGVDMGKDILESVTLRLLCLERHGGNWQVSMCNGSPRFADEPEESGLIEKTGRHTETIDHPEEIIAEDFAGLLLGRGEFKSGIHGAILEAFCSIG